MVDTKIKMADKIVKWLTQIKNGWTKKWNDWHKIKNNWTKKLNGWQKKPYQKINWTKIVEYLCRMTKCLRRIASVIIEWLCLC
jgi:hypothetical protein